MQYLVLYTPSSPMSQPTPEHMAAMTALNEKHFASGSLQLAGALGRREKLGLRITRRNGDVTVGEPPAGESALFGAAGLSVINASSTEELIALVKEFLATAGDGTCEILGFAFPMITPKRGLMDGVIPYLTVPGASKASAFYQKAFAAKELRRVGNEKDDRLMHVHLEINGGSVMLCDEFPDHGHPHRPSDSYVMQLIVSDGDLWFDRAAKAGCEVIVPLRKEFWGDRYGRLRDPFGVEWGFNEPAAGAAPPPGVAR